MSIATVSRVMNSPELVSADTASRVQRVIKRLGYTPHPLAQALGSGESRVLGIALPGFHGQFFSEMLRGADAEATRRGYYLAVTSLTRHPDGRRREHILGSGLMDGTILFIADLDDPLIEEVNHASLPAVVIGVDLSSSGVDSVILDNARGVEEAVEHLMRWVEPGRVYFAGGPRSNFDSMRRAEAFEATLRARGIEPVPEQVTFGEYSFEWGKEWALRMKQRGLLEGAAVLAGNDEIACGIVRAAEDVGVWSPDQLRVVGFDDTLLATLVRPRLSTVALSMAEVGATAVSLLVERLGNERHDPGRCVSLPTRLVVRESSTAMTF